MLRIKGWPRITPIYTDKTRAAAQQGFATEYTEAQKGTAAEYLKTFPNSQRKNSVFLCLCGN